MGKVLALLLGFMMITLMPPVGNTADMVEVVCTKFKGQSFSDEEKPATFRFRPQNGVQKMGKYGEIDITWGYSAMTGANKHPVTHKKFGKGFGFRHLIFEYKSGRVMNLQKVIGQCKFKNLSLIENIRQKKKLADESARKLEGLKRLEQLKCMANQNTQKKNCSGIIVPGAIVLSDDEKDL